MPANPIPLSHLSPSLKHLICRAWAHVGQCERVRDFGALGREWDTFMKALPSGLRELCRKEVRRGEEPEGTDNSKETEQTQRTEALLNSRRLWQQAQGQHGAKPDRSQCWEEKVDRAPASNQQLAAMGSLLQRKN